MKKNTLFILVLLFLLAGISLPVFSGKIPFAGRYLVQQFSPWSNDRRSGLETNLSHKPVGGDDLQLFYPNRVFTNAAYKKGELPLWNPYILSGVPHIGQSETAVLYPLFFLTMILPQYVAWAILILSEPALASIGMYLFLNRLLRNPLAASFGAVTFGFSGIILVRMVEGLSVGHTLLWAPYVLWGIESYCNTRYARYLVLTLFFLSLSVLAGWLQYSFYIFFLSVTYAFVRVSETGKKGKLHLLVVLSLPFILLPVATLPHILPAAQLFLASPRNLAADAGQILIHLMPPAHLLTLLVPDLWGNPGTYTFFGTSPYKESIAWIAVAPLIFSFIGIMQWKKNRSVKFFSILVAVSLVLAIQNPISNWVITSGIPIISTFLPNRIFAVTLIALSVLSGWGFMEVCQKPTENKKNIFRIICFLIIVLGIIAVWSIGTYKQGSQNLSVTQMKVETALFGIRMRSLIIPFLCLSVFLVIAYFWLRKKTLYFFILVVLFITCAQQIFFARKYQEWSEVQYLYPNHPVLSYLQTQAGYNRVLGIGGAHIPSDILELFGLYSAEGIAPNYPITYGVFTKYALTQPPTWGTASRVEVRIEPTQQNVLLERNPALLRLLSLTSTRYIVVWDGDEKIVPDEKVDHTLFRLVWKNGLWRIYEYTSSMPRAFLTTNYEVVGNDTKTLHSIFLEQEPLSRVLLKKSPDITFDKEATGTAIIRIMTSNSVTVQTETNKSMLLFLSDTYWPEFNGYVDGKLEQVLQADYGYRAIRVPTGVHTVEFAYDMHSERISFGIAGGVWVGACILMLYDILHNRMHGKRKE
jgi:hypothetical protein